MTSKRDDELLAYATERQKECLLAYWEHGSLRAAGAALGVNSRVIWQAKQSAERKRMESQAGDRHDAGHFKAPPGFAVKGVSSYVNKDGEVAGQWIKTAADWEQRMAMFQEAIEAFCEDLPRYPAIAAAAHTATNPDWMACYPIGDLHVGMLSWPEETSEDWNLQLAEQIQCAAMARLVEMSPPCEVATIINLGDWFHYDNMSGQTERSGHVVDRDGRFAKMARVGVKIMRRCIDSALQKHGRVHVINVGGNHDDTAAIMLRVCLANAYENDPRVTIDQTPGGFNYFRHGRVLVGCHHGHSCKAERLPGVMAADRAKDWGETVWRYWWTGHVHHQSLKDYPGVTVESFRTLAAKDAYASWGGYRAPRDMKCIILDCEDGEVMRLTANVGMVERQLRATNDKTPASQVGHG